MKKVIVLVLLTLAWVSDGMSLKDSFRESIFVHTDRDIYISGESLFFTVYLYDRNQGKLSDKSKIAYILIYDTDNIPVFQQCLHLNGGIGNSSLYLPDTLKTGKYLFIAYTNWMRNFGDSTFYKKELQIANRFDAEPSGSATGIITDEYIFRDTTKRILSVLPRSEPYNTREKIRFQLSIPSKSQANISVSVAEKLPNHITAVPGTNGSTSDIISGNSHSRASDGKEYLMENKGYIIGGSISNPKSVAGILVILSTPDSIPNIAYAVTDLKGRFYFQVDRYYYDRDLFIQIADRETARESALTLDDKYVCGISLHPAENNSPATFTQFLQKSQIIAKINKTYSQQAVKSEKSTDLSPLATRVYYKPDIRVFTADFIPLDNFHEIVRETLPGARLRKKGNDYSIEIVEMDRKIFMEDPALFINGVFVNNLNRIIHFGSDKIISIEMIYRKRAYGPLIFNGIISIITKDVENDVFPSSPFLHISPVHFLSPGRYLASDYSTPEKSADRTPDFRQLLFWDPSLFMDDGKSLYIEFYTSDNTGSYTIQIEGLTSDGQRIHEVSSFDVLNSPDNQ